MKKFAGWERDSEDDGFITIDETVLGDGDGSEDVDINARVSSEEISVLCEIDGLELSSDSCKRLAQIFTEAAEIHERLGSGDDSIEEID